MVTDLEELRRLKFKLKREVSRIRSSRWILCCRTPTGLSLKEMRGGSEIGVVLTVPLFEGGETPSRPPLPDGHSSAVEDGGEVKPRKLWIRRHQAQLRTGD